MATLKKIPDWLKEGEGFTDITLSRPLDVAGSKLATVRMREPLVRDQAVMSKMEGDNSDKEITMFANLCGLVPADLDAMPMRDYSRLQTAYLAFIA